MREKGLQSSKAAEVVALDTREVKAHVAREELRKSWREVGQKHHWGPEQLQGIMSGPQKPQELGKQLDQAAEDAFWKIMSKESYFVARDFIRGLAEGAQALGCGVDAVLLKVGARLADHSELVRLGERHREAIYTTKSMLALEEDLLQRAVAGKDQPWEKVKESILAWAVGARPTIKAEQEAAIRHITQETGTIALVSGMAGTGKTFMLDATRSVLELAGYRLVGAALSGKAARGLQDETGIPTSTIASLLGRLERGKLKLTEKSVLIIDEAGMVGTQQMHQLLKATQEAKAKLVLVGDQKQLQPIDAGGPFAAINLLLGGAVLEDIVRQREEWQREAVKDLARGESKKALSEYARRGLVSVSADKEEAQEMLLSAWKEAGIAKPKENLIVTGTNLDACVLNRKIQELRIAAGRVNPRDRLEVDGEKICEGDRVLFTKNSKALDVDNGTLGTVLKVSSFGLLSVRLDNGLEKKFSTWSYSHLKLGYAFTTHKTQGMTAENVFVLTSESMQDRELSYVQASRVRGTAKFYTTEAEAGKNLSDLAKTMGRSHQKEMAVVAVRNSELQQEQEKQRQKLKDLEHSVTP